MRILIGVIGVALIGLLLWALALAMKWTRNLPAERLLRWMMVVVTLTWAVVLLTWVVRIERLL